ncbi:hypothetical protein QQ045_014816 [Rhodiola kirilowii]
MDPNPQNPKDDQESYNHRRNPNLSINKLSHKISKSSNSTQKPLLDPTPPMNPNPPPVYNISKSDFRDMVQKLTGPPPSELAEMSRAHHAPPKPPSSSRLHRIRPPPLPQLSSFASPLESQSQNQNQYHSGAQSMSQSSGLTNFGPGFMRPGTIANTPLSPLPPLPSVHSAAESPISAYMRHLRGSSSGNDSETRRLSVFSPRWRSAHEDLMPPPPSSPLGFGCLPSPKSPNLPTAGQLGFPLSPTGKP